MPTSVSEMSAYVSKSVPKVIASRPSASLYPCSAITTNSFSISFSTHSCAFFARIAVSDPATAVPYPASPFFSFALESNFDENGFDFWSSSAAFLLLVPHRRQPFAFELPPDALRRYRWRPSAGGLGLATSAARRFVEFFGESRRRPRR